MALIDLRHLRAAGDESPTVEVRTTIVGSVATMAALHRTLVFPAGASQAGGMPLTPGDEAMAATADGLREALEAEPLVKVRLAAIRTAEAEAEAAAIATAEIVVVEPEPEPEADAADDATERARRSSARAKRAG